MPTEPEPFINPSDAEPVSPVVTPPQPLKPPPGRISDPKAAAKPVLAGGLTPQQGVLNVIIHGLVALFQRDDGSILGSIPDRGADHVYRAGSWLGEKNLRPGTYRLEGVSDPGAAYGKYPEDLLRLRGVRQSSLRRPYVTLEFPPPRRIYGLRRALIRKIWLVGQDQGLYTPFNVDGEGYMATVKVLTYDCPDLNTVALGDHPWNKITVGDVLNLHIYAEEDVERATDSNHSPVTSSAEFNLGLTMFEKEIGGRAVEVLFRMARPDNGGNIARENPKQSELPAGVIRDELFGLAHRTEALELLGRQIKNAEPLNWRGVQPSSPPDTDACSGGDGEG